MLTVVPVTERASFPRSPPYSYLQETCAHRLRLIEGPSAHMACQ